ncbi:MAG: hypothetical protein ACK55U_01650 [Bacteroidota bacterium]
MRENSVAFEGKNNVTWLITMRNESIEYLKTETKNIRVHDILLGYFFLVRDSSLFFQCLKVRKPPRVNTLELDYSIDPLRIVHWF